MYEYSIYWIREEIASHYFHKSDILYRFFGEYQDNSNRIDLRKQYLYITNRFSKNTMISHISMHLKDNVNFHMKGSSMEIYTDRQYISLHISEKQLKFRSGSLQDAEEILFPVLRIFQPFLFVIGNTDEKYGWITPVKLPKAERENRVLYSW
ncbi:sporulation inhibitor of replication protein SirA [Oceanobacillus bengalensis]|uniref:Sporulation inhibitor of replication protein SirA n=1 Tax=Oceanobacillus bengalensis TaxID=1435466 RepID=A0A494Z4N9_9BACI|nr:sporulation inhibitor of replication protein SirA [Oceanobacillus bengalensis]RKQ17280.1 sporulation inhibitor of replication protein SirA [Oceanobacillus bengalensis]